MLDEKNLILDWVEKHPQTEDVFRSFDTLVGKCILCECLFESIETISQDNKVDLSDLLKKLYLVIQST